MKLQLFVPKDKRDQVKTKLKEILNIQSETEENNTIQLVVLIEPKNFREVDGTLKEAGGRSDVLQHAVKPESDDKF